MFAKKVTVTENRKKHVYIEVFQDKPGGGRKPEPLARFGPVDRIAGKLDGVVNALREFCTEKFARPDEITPEAIRSWGPVMVSRHLWDELGLGKMISGVCGSDVSHAVFALTANRLIDPNYEHGMDKWLDRNFVVDARGRGLDLDRLRKKVLTTKSSSKCLWDAVLHKIAAKHRSVQRRFVKTVEPFCPDMREVFLYDVSGSFVEGAPSRRTPGGWAGQVGRRNIRLFLGAIACEDWPLSFRFFGGSEPSAAQIKRFAEESRRQLGFRKLIVVLPSGTDEEKLHELSSLGLHYLVGVRRRRDPRAVEAVQEAGHQWKRINNNIKVQEVLLPVESDAAFLGEPTDDFLTERYVLVHGAQEEKEEQTFRLAVVARALRALEQLTRAVEAGRVKKHATIMARADRILSERKAYRYISWRMTPEGRLLYWEDKAKSAVRRNYEGISLLKTSDPDISPPMAVRAYEGLRRLEIAYSKVYDAVALRSGFLPLPELEEKPRDGGSGDLFTAHLLITWLALLLRRRLEECLVEKKSTLSLEDALEALRTISLAEVRVAEDKRCFVSPGNRTAHKVLRALGIEALPPGTACPPAAPGGSLK